MGNNYRAEYRKKISILYYSVYSFSINMKYAIHIIIIVQITNSYTGYKQYLYM